MIRQLRMRFPDLKSKAFTMSYDDGVEQDIRLIELMRRHGIKGTFNLSSGEYPPEGHKWPEGQVHRRMPLSECQKVYSGSDIEVAIHGTHHPFWNSQPAPSAMWDIINDRKMLEEQYGGIIRGAAYPFGAFDDTAVELLRLAGIKYCRTVISSHRFDMPHDWLRLEATCHHRDEKLNELTEKFISAEPRPGQEPMLFYLWGHAYEFEGNDNWYIIEDLLEKIGGRDDIWYATNLEICNYSEAFDRLEFSVDGNRIYNPTSTDLYATDGQISFEIKAGSVFEF